MAFEDAMVVICMLDDKIKIKQAIHLVVKVIIGVVFLGILMGIFALFLFVKQT